MKAEKDPASAKIATLTKSDLRKAWRQTKTDLLTLRNLSPAGKKTVSAVLKKFDSGTGALLDKHANEIMKLPKSSAKVDDLYDKIKTKITANRKLLLDALAGADRDAVETYLDGQSQAILAALKEQEKLFDRLINDKTFMNRPDAQAVKDMGTEAQAQALLKDVQETLAKMTTLLKQARAALDRIDEVNSSDAAAYQMGAAKGAILAKSGAAAESAKKAAKVALLFREKLNKPRDTVVKRLKAAKEFHKKEKDVWSKARGSKLGSFYDLEDAIAASEKFLGDVGSSKDELLAYIRDKNRVAKLSLIYAGWSK